jgi:hypothetical protein
MEGIFLVVKGVGNWEVPSLVDGLKSWMDNKILVDHKALPYIVYW